MTSYPSYMDHHANFDHPTTVANWGTVMSTTTPKNNNHSTTYFSWTVSFGLCFASFFLVITVVSWYIRQRRLQALQQSSISSRRFSRDPVSMSRPPSTVNEVTVPPSYEDCVQARGGASKDQITGDEALPDYTNVSNNNESTEPPSPTTTNGGNSNELMTKYLECVPYDIYSSPAYYHSFTSYGD
ncbi:uncharacterized protein TRIADDRAFT_62662 [Trichoplax adhaerens]|uniref:Uncharacterized protein n=1 Tax=Trichoplax adhaerens TaxID=10228 RepID=B3SEH3_TRIAD|nr:predicted protein [Trichoplax adhaerens]EDV18872.1 predicted protein [Trichoplax adhaerens]|eukprot:XP_002118642.1 predicted protein [Trichoplax adhaerens]